MATSSASNSPSASASPVSLEPKKMVKANPKYVKMNPREHVLARPGMYIGSVEIDTMDQWIYDTSLNKMKNVSLNYIPGLFKIFDEILVNVLDHITRLSGESGPVKVVKEIRVNISDDAITIMNDGEGVEVYEHEEHSVYIPELVFGNMLTSTNYDDTQERVIGGQNGIGAKACNIYSTEFHLETVDSKRKLLYKQSFSNNMAVCTPPEITKYSKYPYTKIKFFPDFEKFGIKNGCIPPDMVHLYSKRVYDLCALSPPTVKVFLNDHKLECVTFEKYVDMYIGGKGDTSRVVDVAPNGRWKIVVSESNNGFQQVSFVNGINTMKGGKHVDYITNQITKRLGEMIMKKKKGGQIKPQHIKDQLFIFVNCTVVNPTFDSQTKETLTTPASKFGSKYEIDEKVMEKVYKLGIVERALSVSASLDDKNSKKTDGKKRSSVRGIAKLDDANWAGTAKSGECTLILTEGDSAKTMAISGLSEVGRNRYGVFPLRGKVMNVKEMTAKRINDNEEITNLKKILGLETNKVYTSTKGLRYGSIMIMTDSDVDGSHIKGLLFNVFHTMWPSLLKMNGFLKSMLTPIIKVTRGRETLSFYCLKDYDDWKETTSGGRGWAVKYYKGLGTSTSAEAKDYFKKLEVVRYDWDEVHSNESIDLAFNKKRSDDRKVWISGHSRDTILDYTVRNIEYSDFVNKELVHFSVYNLERSIPSMCDGLKKSLRKILHCCFKRNLTKEIKVAQLAGYVSEHGAYHHGEVSLQDAIVGMAQTFIGSNNINLLCPNGQFGSRIQGGKDSASARYIHTQLNMPLVSAIFPDDDREVLHYLEDDGIFIEPEYFIPVIPMVLVNGANGIGTGFSTNVPCYNPVDIIRHIRTLMVEGVGTPLDELVPWYRGHTGKIVNGVSYGCFHRTDKTKIEVTELPIGVWTDDFKGLLEHKLESGCKQLKDYQSHYTETTVNFVLVFFDEGIVDQLMATHPTNESITNFEHEFKMTNSRPLGTTNMHLYDHEGKIKKYDTANDIIRDFYSVRLRMYGVRKAHRITKLRKEMVFLDARIKFILSVISGELTIMNEKKSVIEEHLVRDEYPTQDDKYDYLIKMSMFNFTYEKKEELVKERNKMRDALVALEDTTEYALWSMDLDHFESIYNK
jgi:DNA topoisomerase-2